SAQGTAGRYYSHVSSGSVRLRSVVMTAQFRNFLSVAAVVAISVTAAACGSNASVAAAPKPEPLAIVTASVDSRPIDRYLRVTGSLLADQQAEVSAEATGRVIATPVERGARVAQGALLVGVSPTET